MPGRTIISCRAAWVNGGGGSLIKNLKDEILDKVRTVSKLTFKADSIRVEAVSSKARAGLPSTIEEHLELFDANTRWLDELQAKQLSEANAQGTRITRENRGWTREDLYENLRGFSQ